MVNDLFWNDRAGCGYFPVDPADWPYDAGYFERYASYEGSAIAERLNAHRVALAQKFAAEAEIIDVGIGCGSFIERARARGLRVVGYDINPAGVAWLRQRGWFREIAPAAECVTFWDSFEHIARPDKLLAFVRATVIMSLPVYRDRDHARGSKHFRPTEHYWYFTRAGLIEFMAAAGFGCVCESDAETRCGREDIMSFVFRRGTRPKAV